MNILGHAGQDVAGAQAWARSRGAEDIFVDLAPLYWRYAPERGVRPEVAYAQCAKETAFCRFGGVIDATYCNPCGLKTKDGGANSDPDAHQRFPNWDVGVIAHLDHLALYAGALGYPRKDTPDPRHFDWVLAKAETVEELGGAWAPSTDYGTSLATYFVTPLLLARAPETPLAARLATFGDVQAASEALREEIDALPTQSDTVAVAMDALEARLHDAVTRFLS